MSSFGFGLITAAVLAIATVGFTMQFAVTNVLNLAYGSIMINSAFVAYYLNIHGVNAWVSLAGRDHDGRGGVVGAQSIHLHPVPAAQPGADHRGHRRARR